MVAYKTGDFNFGVAIYPPLEIRQKAEEITSRIAATVPLIFQLDQTHFPHITLFQGAFPCHAKETLEEVVKNIVSHFESEFFIEMSPELFFHPVGNVFWNAQKSPVLMNFHTKSIEALRPLTEGALMQQWIDRLQDPNTDLNEKQKELVLRNGFAESGELYLPHITLGRLAEKSDAIKIKDIFVSSENFLVHEIIAGPLGSVGNIEEIWFSYKLTLRG